jgi:ubiquitin carboxyl-terminal hydrolase 34
MKDNEEVQENASKVSSKRCYTIDSRKAGYSLLNEYMLCLEPKEMGEYLRDYVMPLVKDVERPKKWKH